MPDLSDLFEIYPANIEFHLTFGGIFNGLIYGFIIGLIAGIFLKDVGVVCLSIILATVGGLIDAWIGIQIFNAYYNEDTINQALQAGRVTQQGDWEKDMMYELVPEWFFKYYIYGGYDFVGVVLGALMGAYLRHRYVVDKTN